MPPSIDFHVNVASGSAGMRRVVWNTVFWVCLSTHPCPSETSSDTFQFTFTRQDHRQTTRSLSPALSLSSVPLPTSHSPPVERRDTYHTFVHIDRSTVLSPTINRHRISIDDYRTFSVANTFSRCTVSPVVSRIHAYTVVPRSPLRFVYLELKRAIFLPNSSLITKKRSSSTTYILKSS